MMVTVGVLHAIEGFVALFKDSYYVVDARAASSSTVDYTGWGWVHLILGVLVALAGVALFSGRMWARVVGVGARPAQHPRELRVHAGLPAVGHHHDLRRHPRDLRARRARPGDARECERLSPATHASGAPTRRSKGDRHGTSPADLVGRALGRHAEQTGLLVASAIAPGTFARSLGPRSVGDQAFVTGVVTALTYATTVATQDALTALAVGGAAGTVRPAPGRRSAAGGWPPSSSQCPWGWPSAVPCRSATTSGCCAAPPARPPGGRA